MKKSILSLACVMTAIAFAPQAFAVPAFSRQTGQTCSSCHFQHFPLLNATGQEFKASGFTKMSANNKFKGDDLSIPDQVNLSGFTTTYFQTESSGKTGGVANAATVPKWGVPATGGEFSLFIGGRISSFMGFLAEAGLGGGGANDVTGNGNTTGTGVIGTSPGGGVVGDAKLVMLFPVGDARIGPVIYTNNGQGAAYSFELLNTGAVNTQKMMGNNGPNNQHVRASYAAQYLNTNQSATGVHLVANNSMGFINIGAYEMAGNQMVGGANNLNLRYIRVASTMEYKGWETGFGIQNFGGTSTVTGVTPKATIIDAQMQSDLGGTSVGIYASYGTAAAGSSDAAGSNPFNPAGGKGGAAFVAGSKSASSFNLAAEFGVIPHGTIQVAMRMAKNGAAIDNGDNALMLGVTYELVQNVGLSFHHTMQSGSAWNTDAAGNQTSGKNSNTLLLEALF
jgi:hypothetical protein